MAVVSWLPLFCFHIRQLVGSGDHEKRSISWGMRKETTVEDCGQTIKTKDVEETDIKAN